MQFAVSIKYVKDGLFTYGPFVKQADALDFGVTKSMDLLRPVERWTIINLHSPEGKDDVHPQVPL